MNNYLKEDGISRQKANWEINNDKRLNQQMTTEEKRRLKEQKETFLDLRRKKLSDLLINEDIMYHKEILDKQEDKQIVYTPIGKTQQTYTIRKSEDGQYQIINKEGKEVISGVGLITVD